jgi:hypothetical protein
MIYLKDSTDLQTLFIPKDGEKPEGSLFLKAYSSINLFGFVTEVIDLDTTDLYYRIAVKLADNVQAGEYEYNLYDGKKTLSSGILIIGDIEIMQEYENITTYKQYGN